MLLKITGFILVMMATTAAGVFFAGKDGYRAKDLYQMKTALNILKSEIEYALTPVPEAMGHISQKINEPVNQIFKCFYDTALTDKKIGIYDIWEKSIEENKSCTYFEKDDIECFKCFGKTLGYLDKNMQLNSIEITLDYIDEKIDMLNSVSDKNKKLYTSLGILSGLMICVVLF